ncbi:GTP-binding protein [Actinomadura rubteroloni]|nr:ATP/GTP-binding protein [Actinomadura rubteroloni]
MVSASWPEPRRTPSARRHATSVKIMVAGGLGVGKTTAVQSISEIATINTDNWMTESGRPLDALADGQGKTTTTVAMDFGRITLESDLVLYLFGTPGQPRFWTIWEDLCRGASAALVLADARRLETSFPAIDYFERDADIPFAVAVNRFDDVLAHPVERIRAALELPEHVPLTTVDARSRSSVARALITTVGHSLRQAVLASGGDASGAGR